MKKISIFIIIFLLFYIGLQNILSNIEANEGTNLEKVIFVDKFKYIHETPNTVDPSECDQTSNKFRVFSGGIKWNSFPITYSINTSGFNDADTSESEAKAAVIRAFETWDAENHGGDATNKFFEESSTFDANIRFSWQLIDGPGNTLGVATFNYNTQSKTIQSATIVLDSDDKWRIFDSSIVCGDQSFDPALLEFDIEDVAAHEIGHAIGFDHVNGKSSLFNTEYPFIIFEGETHKRTLGLGDRLGLELLYGNGGSMDSGSGKCPPGNPNHPKCD